MEIKPKLNCYTDNDCLRKGTCCFKCKRNTNAEPGSCMLLDYYLKDGEWDGRGYPS